MTQYRHCTDNPFDHFKWNTSNYVAVCPDNPFVPARRLKLEIVESESQGHEARRTAAKAWRVSSLKLRCCLHILPFAVQSQLYFKLMLVERFAVLHSQHQD